MPDLPRPVLMLVTDRNLAGGEDALAEAIAVAVEGGVNVVQLREKDMGSQELSVLAGRLREALAGRSLLIVNGDADVAAEADGLHLPEGAGFARVEGKLVGRSVHSVEAAQQAAAEGVDYIVAGSIFATGSHEGETPVGLRLLSEATNAVDVPVIAIGGITSERVHDVMAAGAAGVAVISAILGSESPGGAAHALRSALDGERKRTDRDEPSVERR
ncbi:MAG TPA: thiamine phosphate synthase [Dehalococcoidia bacterium]|nr:thiamine phosphate synthase [Dehalococcoidia bacterium]